MKRKIRNNRTLSFRFPGGLRGRYTDLIASRDLIGVRAVSSISTITMVRRRENFVVCTCIRVIRSSQCFVIICVVGINHHKLASPRLIHVYVVSSLFIYEMRCIRFPLKLCFLQVLWVGVPLIRSSANFVIQQTRYVRFVFLIEPTKLPPNIR